MSALECSDFARAAGGAWFVEPRTESLSFAGVCIDTRDLIAGQVFFAFVGAHSDGHEYLDQARRLGAAACVVTHPQRVPEGFDLPVLVVDDPTRALTDLASAWREKITARVIAITGSNGKTTTCRMMHSVCAQAGKSFVSPRSFNNALGVPITLLNTPMNADYLVAEVGMSTPGEIAARTALLRPDLSIITSIGRAHLEALGSTGNIAREKAQVILAAPQNSIGVIPGGVSLLEEAMSDAPHRIVRLYESFSVHDAGSDACGFSIGDTQFEVPMPGEHNASNAALCVLAARALGFDDESIRAGLASASPPGMRFERVIIETSTSPITIINDAYNANPDSMRAALTTFSALDTTGPKLAILGEMLELGDSGNAEHQALVTDATGLGGIDRFVFIGAAFIDTDTGAESNPRASSSGIVHDHSDESIARIASTISAGDTLLIKGSRGVKLERLIPILSDMHASSRSQNHPDSAPHA